MCTATDGGTGFEERIRASGERPIGAASFRQQSIQASCQPPPPARPRPIFWVFCTMGGDYPRVFGGGGARGVLLQ